MFAGGGAKLIATPLCAVVAIWSRTRLYVCHKSVIYKKKLDEWVFGIVVL